MEFTRTSFVDNVTRTLDLPVTQAQYEDWKRGTLIQHAMPNLTPEQREFIISGVTEEQWCEMFDTYDPYHEHYEHDEDYDEEGIPW